MSANGRQSTVNYQLRTTYKLVARLESPAVNRATALLFALLVVIFAVVAVENRGAFSAKPATAPPSEFSAERARAALRAILGGDIPHPVGSAAHDAVRDRLVAHLQSLGYDMTLQRAFA